MNSVRLLPGYSSIAGVTGELQPQSLTHQCRARALGIIRRACLGSNICTLITRWALDSSITPLTHGRTIAREDGTRVSFKPVVGGGINRDYRGVFDRLLDTFELLNIWSICRPVKVMYV